MYLHRTVTVTHQMIIQCQTTFCASMNNTRYMYMSNKQWFVHWYSVHRFISLSIRNPLTFIVYIIIIIPLSLHIYHNHMFMLMQGISNTIHIAIFILHDNSRKFIIKLAPKLDKSESF